MFTRDLPLAGDLHRCGQHARRAALLRRLALRPEETDVKIELGPGDGKRLTRDEIKTLMAGRGAPTGAAAPRAAEDKAKREEIMKKNAEIEASNKKAEASNAIIDRTFKAGNEALRAKNYDLAIAQYDEGLTADPEHPGAPALLTNKTMALNARAVDKYNAGIRVNRRCREERWHGSGEERLDRRHMKRAQKQ